MNDIQSLSFEAAFAELETIVERLAQGDLPLEDCLALYERGVALSAWCNQQLDQAELRIEQLKPRGDGFEVTLFSGPLDSR